MQDYRTRTASVADRIQRPEILVAYMLKTMKLGSDFMSMGGITSRSGGPTHGYETLEGACQVSYASTSWKISELGGGLQTTQTPGGNTDLSVGCGLSGR